MKNIIFIHGLESSGQGYKGRFFKKIFPNILTPDFKGNLDERLNSLEYILKNYSNINIIGSSFGGLMATIYAFKNEKKVEKIILLAPALNFYNFEKFNTKLTIPVTIYHGSKDSIVPIAPVKKTAKKIFDHLQFNIVNDDHMLHNTINKIDWESLI